MTARGVKVSGVDKAFDEVPVLTGIDLDVAPGQSVALLGPSGCGKTTLLRIIAGLERPDLGTVAIGDTVMTGPGSWVPPERRNVGMVFQDWALFPHLSVGRNVGYGLPRAERGGPRVTEALDMVGLAGLEDRMPDTLSGGQQQRVALARAIAPRPSVLLLDEPFSNLDTSLRVEVRAEVHRLLVELGITSVFVTHDQEEAFVLGDQVAVMNGGRIEQVGSPYTIYREPVSPWIASFVGDVNLVPAIASGSTAVISVGEIPLDSAADGPGMVLIRPEDLEVGATGPHEVTFVEFYGHDMMLTVAVDGTELQVRTAASRNVVRGEHVSVMHRGAPARFFADAAS